jgi:hypothetical protein
MKDGSMVMDHPLVSWSSGVMTIDSHQPTTTSTRFDRGDHERHRRRVLDALAARSFMTLATASSGGIPHAAGVSYALAERGDDLSDLTLYVNTMRSSRKARNVAATGRAAIVVPVRKVPIGPPFTIQFQADADVVALTDPEIVGLVDAGRLKAVTSHGELDEPDGCFIRLRPRGRIHSYGLGVSVIALARDPLHVGARSIG